MDTFIYSLGEITLLLGSVFLIAYIFTMIEDYNTERKERQRRTPRK